MEYLKALQDEEILHFIHFHINNSTTKNYCTRWIHKEHTAEWAAPLAQYHYKIDDIKKFKGEGKGIRRMRRVS